MASPIRWFRKHSQFFIVVFGVVLMAIFGLGSVLTSINPADFAGRGNPDDKVVAKFEGGDLTKSNLFLLRQKHFAARRLIEHVYKYAVEQNDGESFPFGVEPILPIVQQGEDPTIAEMDERIMNRYLFAKKAEKEGFIVDENMVMEYLAQFSGDVDMTKNLLKQLNRQVNQSVNLTSVIRHLQTELLWQQMESLTRGGLPFDSVNQVSVNAINPTEAIQLYARANQRIECKVLPISVEEQLAKVTDEPTDQEQRHLYDEGKYDYPSYNYKTPGFKELKKAKLQMFVGELENFLQNEMAKLTDEEVQAEYDHLVEADDNLVMQPVEVEKDDAPSDDNAANDSADTPETPDSDADDPAPVPGSEENASEDEGSAPESSTDSTELTEEPAEGGGGYTSVRFQDENAEQDESDDPSETDNEESEEQDSADTEELDSADAPSTDGNDAETEDKTSGDEISDPEIEDEPKIKREPKPLKDVAEEVKRRMARQAAVEARDEALLAAEKELREYQMKMDRWSYPGRGEEKKEDDKPAPPDFNVVAEKHGLLFSETETIDQTQVDDVPLGQVVDISIVNGRAQQINIGQEIFRNFDSTEEYQTFTVNDFRTSSKYLYWMSEKTEQTVPSFEEAHDAIVKYYKYEKAVELAIAEANQIAEQVNSAAGKTLSDIAPEKAVDTGAFSWFSTFGRFAYGSPEGVSEPGEDFMETAFSLDKNKAAVALNEPRDTVYVVQNVTPLEMTVAQLGNDYLEKNFFKTNQIPREVVSAKALYRQRMNFEWLREFLDDMNVDVVGQ